VDPLRSEVTIEGKTGRTPTLTFKNDDTGSAPIGRIRGLTAPTEADQAANKWYVDNQNVNYFEYSLTAGIPAGYSKSLSASSYGTWMINLQGTLPDGDPGSPYEAKIILNSTVNSSLKITNHPDGSAPICLSTFVTVNSTSNYITISTINNMTLQRITAYRLAASGTSV
jgi:hypothetical protein